ncbi:MAG: hypothetical protein IT211_04285 [Armatimonadetes bacterium]|nr:hypothetical protein [Armatimonadota bacterium]
MTFPETTTLFPIPATTSVSDFVQNLANRFGITPTFGWARFNLGTHTPQLSPLSGGDIQLFGAGVDLSPGHFRIVASAGAVGRRVMTDTVAGTEGEYARHAYMGKLAYVDSLTEIGLNLVRVRDDGASIPVVMKSRVIQPDGFDPTILDTLVERDPLMPVPEESFTATLNVQFPITKGVRVAAEVASSLFTRDMESQPVSKPISAIEPLLAQRLSTRADLAGNFSVMLEQEAWGLNLKSSYIGPGYHTLAYPWMEADKVDVTMEPHIALFDDALRASGTIGWRRNNLADQEEATTTQLLGSATIDARIGDALSINGQYANYGIRTPVRNDTFRVETVSQSFSVTPVLVLPTENLTHVITASVGFDTYTDLNPVSGADGRSQTRNLSTSYSASLASIPLSLELSGSWLVNQLSIGEMEVTGVGLGAGYRLLGNDVTLGASAQLTQTALGNIAPDNDLMLRLTSTWRITESLQFRAQASTISYRYGDSRPGVSFRENLLRASLQWQW